MTGYTRLAPQRGLVCCICEGPVPLETCKTDEHGKAVHEECYMHKIAFSFLLAQADSSVDLLRMGFPGSFQL